MIKYDLTGENKVYGTYEVHAGYSKITCNECRQNFFATFELMHHIAKNHQIAEDLIWQEA